mmetsp:Transcript_1031/g.2201  ORF Transcript_1031/g.2201 Transcript_1031/m.2201 type:complete len:127 (-) Transcript_1031:587-967(-)
MGPHHSQHPSRVKRGPLQLSKARGFSPRLGPTALATHSRGGGGASWGGRANASAGGAESRGLSSRLLSLFRSLLRLREFRLRRGDREREREPRLFSLSFSLSFLRCCFSMSLLSQREGCLICMKLQ